MILSIPRSANANERNSVQIEAALIACIRTFRFYFAAIALGFSALSHATNIDCEKTKSRVELLMCEDGDLLRHDLTLRLTYSNVLDIVPNPKALRAEQQRWIRTIRNRCKTIECLTATYADRIETLTETWGKHFISAGIAGSKANANRSNIFEGAWKYCTLHQGSESCGGYLLLQQGNRICGEWDYFATSRIYSGQLQATLSGPNKVDVNLICGEPGSATSTFCDNDEKPNGRWEKAKDELMICEGQLYENGNATCGNLKRRTGYYYHPIPEAERKRLLAEPWVKACLANK